MSAQKPSLPQGTRDFGPAVVARRNYIFGIIRRVFEKFGYAPLETPTLENLSVLTGKYGEEGDQLLFKVLNSGNFLKKQKGDVIKEEVTPDDLLAGPKKVLPKIAEKGLRYDLTVPFARYVVMNRGTLTFPFKRYQIQPVWRADRPQRGRYREFYQCDADVVGTDSLLCEAEIVLMMSEVLNALGLTDYTIKINHRKILSGLYEALRAEGKEADLFVAIDKLDKIGPNGVSEELSAKGYSNDMIKRLFSFLSVKGNFHDKLTELEKMYKDSIGELRDDSGIWFEIVEGQQYAKSGFIRALENARGFDEIKKVYNYLQAFDFTQFDNLEFDPTLARGLSYYTGCIFEIKINNVNMGSVSGGGRYDNLTGAFGLPGVSGVGFSFGVDRLYDCLEELNLFPSDAATTTRCLVANFDVEGERAMLPVLRQLREAGVASELYPEAGKLGRQFKYADAKGIPFVLLQGSEERAQGRFKLKTMSTGQEQTLTLEEVLAVVQA
ncbi:histidine--tRNA ligase [Hymenobacter psychrotolerans]|uniref:Histidine--tRNA ligase n=1 Tax=Hymenobacter psychrotolerans DSM 18569 TaxID=1121959 RepID=A0A1M7FFE6_9BACT|nr:histidine--tRNA ligase [Hymenobacter psychrotolerans]SHM02832.1 histidyl-tRNA synthetase [Hymenobacter psychrotolerans DSM 18569]